MKHRKYDTITVAIDSGNNAHQVCYNNMSCFGEYRWETTLIGPKKRFEMYRMGVSDLVDGHQITNVGFADLRSYFSESMTATMSKALKINNLLSQDICKFLVISVDHNLSGVTRVAYRFVGHNGIDVYDTDCFDPAEKLECIVYSIMGYFGFHEFDFSY